MLPQTKRIIRVMQLAGFKRNEFSVRTHREKTQITLYRTDSAYMESKIPGILENGINVTQIYGMPNHITTYLLELTHKEKGVLKYEYGMSFC